MVYDFFRQLGVTHLQFLPLGKASPGAPPPEAVGTFLCRVFDRWIAEDVGRIVIQTFDEALRPVYGIPHALCIHRETCGDVAVLEHDGGLYACDHFVDADHLIGNLKDRTLSDMMADPRMSLLAGQSGMRFRGHAESAMSSHPATEAAPRTGLRWLLTVSQDSITSALHTRGSSATAGRVFIALHST